MLVVSEEKSFMVMAHTAVEKDAWLQAIRLCMRDVSIKAESSEQVGGWACRSKRIHCTTVLCMSGNVERFDVQRARRRGDLIGVKPNLCKS